MAVVNKFKAGDKVISVKNTPEVPEGSIGYILTQKMAPYDYVVDVNVCHEYFNEDELELLSASVRIPQGPDRDDITPYDIDPPKKATSALDKQISGNHYKDCGIQPIEYIHANNLSYFQGNVVKYVTRYKDKAGKADLEKAIHYLELMIELEYSE